jgi:excisionase family DNA binding protein
MNAQNSVLQPGEQKGGYCLKRAAEYLDVSTRTVERLIKRRLLKRSKALGKIIIPKAELDRFLSSTL